MSINNKIDEDLQAYAKTEDDLNKEVISKFNDIGLATHKGSITMLFANIINSVISTCYKTISKLFKNCFISTATNEYLDDIALRYSIKRISGESDEDLRYRISIHNLYNSLCNFEGIRQRILDKYPSVEDIKINEFVKGTGSCQFIIFASYLEDYDFLSIKKDILMYAPPGVHIQVITPSSKYYTMKIAVELNVSNLSDSDLLDIKKMIKSSISKIMSESNNRIVEYYEIIKTIKDSSEHIHNAKIIQALLDEENIKLNIIEPQMNYRNVLSSNTEILFI